MATQFHSKPQNSSLRKFQNIVASKSRNVAELPALPLATLAVRHEVNVDAQAQQVAFETELSQIKSNLLKAQRSATLARSQSLNAVQRQSLTQEAQTAYGLAQVSLKNLLSLSNRMGGEARRKARVIEGAAEWRQVRHSIARNAETQRLAA